MILQGTILSEPDRAALHSALAALGPGTIGVAVDPALGIFAFRLESAGLIRMGPGTAALFVDWAARRGPDQGVAAATAERG